MPSSSAVTPTSLAALHAAEQVPIADLLGYVSSELRKLCSAAFEVEEAVGPLITDRSERGLVGVQGLQELDRMIQYIEGLADYLEALSEASVNLGTVDPTAARKLIKVARLAEGLAGRCVMPHGGGGDFEML
jgi:hypothetical protein